MSTEIFIVKKFLKDNKLEAIFSRNRHVYRFGRNGCDLREKIRNGLVSHKQQHIFD